MSSPADGPRCPSCGAELHWAICADCGQRRLDLDRPFLELPSEGLANLLAFDTRLARTLWPLIRRPGMLTVEFLAGRRARWWMGSPLVSRES